MPRSGVNGAVKHGRLIEFFKTLVKNACCKAFLTLGCLSLVGAPLKQ